MQIEDAPADRQRALSPPKGRTSTPGPFTLEGPERVKTPTGVGKNDAIATAS
jgi:hypothetical protein